MYDDVAPSRAIAIAMGLPKYQGAPCRAGHEGVRRVGNKACVDCARQYDKARKAADPEGEAARKAAWRKANPDKRKAERQRYRAKHGRAIAERDAAYRESDPHGAIAKRKAIAFELAAKRAADRALTKAKRDAYRQSPEYRANLKARRKAARLAKMAAMDEFELHDLQVRQRAAYLARKETDPMGTQFLWRIHSALKRAKQKRPEGNHDATTLQVRQLYAWQDGKCAYCGEGEPLEIDHKKPLALAGDHTIGNLQWLCRFHNQHKRDIPDLEYRRLMGIPLVTPWE